jgi:hypothetical protein
MPDYERVVEVAASADTAFVYLANPANLPQYIATMTAAEPRGGETVHVAADVQGRHEEGDAQLHRDPTQRRLEWRGQGEHNYTGWLQVSPAAAGSAVTVHIHSDHGDNEAEINRAFDETMNRIKRLVEADD